MPEKPQKPRSSSATTPDDFSVPSPTYTSGDYSYTVELVGSIQHELGKLTEATGALKEQVKEHGRKIDEASKKLDEVRMDIHGAKTGAKVLVWVIGIVGALLGMFLAAFFRKILGVSGA